MRLQEVMMATHAKCLASKADLEREVNGGFASDLMSDVLRYDLSQSLLISGLANPQVVRTAEIADAAAILMVRARAPLPETLQLAEQVGIPILCTDMIMFEACARLNVAGMPPCRLRDGAS